MLLFIQGAPADALADDVNNIINGLRDVELDVAAISSEVVSRL